ncbi:hypothetical protein IAR50_003637 [Cryptococcus sp. DSM 104548]
MEALAVHKSESPPPPPRPNAMDRQPAAKSTRSANNAGLSPYVHSSLPNTRRKSRLSDVYNGPSSSRESSNVPAMGPDTPTGPSRHRPRPSAHSSSGPVAQGSSKPYDRKDLKELKKQAVAESSDEEEEGESNAARESSARITKKGVSRTQQRQPVRVYRPSASGSDEGDIAVVADPGIGKQPSRPPQQPKSNGSRNGQGSSSNPFFDARLSAGESNHRDARHMKRSRVSEDDRDSDVEEVPPKAHKSEEPGMGTGKGRLADFESYTLKAPPRKLKPERRPMRNKDGIAAPTDSSTPQRQRRNGQKDQVPKGAMSYFKVASVSRMPLGPFHTIKVHFYNPHMKFAHREGGGTWTVRYEQLQSLELCAHDSHPLVKIILDPKDFVNDSALKRLLGHDSVAAMDDLKITLIPEQSDNLNATLIQFFDKVQAAVKTKANVDVHQIEGDVCQVYRDVREDEDRKLRAEAAERRSNGESSRNKQDQNSIESRVRKTTKGKSKLKKAEDEDSKQSKLDFVPRPQPERSFARPMRKAGQVANEKSKIAAQYHEIGSSDDDEAPVLMPLGPPVNRDELYFAYPLREKAAVTITRGDVLRVQQNDFLNDTLLEFGLRHVLDQFNNVTKDKIHIFNSFFYLKLANKTKGSKPTPEGWAAYDSVKKWTKGKDIFNKKFVVVPINEHFHWYLAVIINPAGILQKTNPKSDVRTDIAEVQSSPNRPTTRAAAAAAEESSTAEIEVPASAEQDAVALYQDSTADDEPQVAREVDESQSAQPERILETPFASQAIEKPRASTPRNDLFPPSSPLTSAPPSPDAARVSSDPINALDQTGDDDEDVQMQGVSSAVESLALAGDSGDTSKGNLRDGPKRAKAQRMSIEDSSDEGNAKDDGEDGDTGQGKFIDIMSSALAHNRQPAGKVSAESAHQDDDDVVEIVGPSTGKKIKKGKATANKEKKALPKKKGDDANFNDGRTWIVTFDSLGGKHPAVGTMLSRWLEYEAKDKHNVAVESQAVYWPGFAPAQPNFVDCGLYVVWYTQQLLQKTDAIFDFVQRQQPYKTDPDHKEWQVALDSAWSASETSNLRNKWVTVMENLHSEWKKVKEERAAAGIPEDIDEEGDSQIQVIDKEEQETLQKAAKAEYEKMLKAGTLEGSQIGEGLSSSRTTTAPSPRAEEGLLQRPGSEPAVRDGNTEKPQLAHRPSSVPAPSLPKPQPAHIAVPLPLGSIFTPHRVPKKRHPPTSAHLEVSDMPRSYSNSSPAHVGHVAERSNALPLIAENYLSAPENASDDEETLTLLGQPEGEGGSNLLSDQITTRHHDLDELGLNREKRIEETNERQPDVLKRNVQEGMATEEEDEEEEEEEEKEEEEEEEREEERGKGKERDVDNGLSAPYIPPASDGPAPQEVILAAAQPQRSTTCVVDPENDHHIRFPEDGASISSAPETPIHGNRRKTTSKFFGPTKPAALESAMLQSAVVSSSFPLPKQPAVTSFVPEKHSPGKPDSEALAQKSSGQYAPVSSTDDGPFASLSGFAPASPWQAKADAEQAQRAAMVAKHSGADVGASGKEEEEADAPVTTSDKMTTPEKVNVPDNVTVPSKVTTPDVGGREKAEAPMFVSDEEDQAAPASNSAKKQMTASALGHSFKPSSFSKRRVVSDGGQAVPGPESKRQRSEKHNEKRNRRETMGNGATRDQAIELEDD